jgi:hypothetical protein
MKNPWEDIPICDYESHMKLDTVMQLQVMNAMMKNQFYQYPVKTIMVLGIAGGNGLEHVDTQRIDKIYGVDINNEYLKKCTERYINLKGILECLCVDLADENISLPSADIVIANLLIEYIGYECFQNVIVRVKPRYVSCIIQVNTDDSFVSDSPYLHAFDHLDEVHHEINECSLVEVMKNIGYDKIEKTEKTLPNGKKLVCLDFKC